MRILTGDDTGLLKSIRLEAQKIEKLGEWRKGDAAERLCWGGPPDNREARVLAAYESGALESRDATSGRVLCSTKLAPKVRCLQTLGDRVLAVCQDGSANIIANWCGEADPVPPPEEPEAEGAGAEGSQAPRGPGYFELPGPIAGAQVDPCNARRLVFGGGENDLKIWDLEGGKATWKAKNMKENYLCLRIPLKISCLSWATPVAPSRSMIVCGTTDGKIRLYDANAQRRPLCELVIGFGMGGGTGGHTGVIDDTPRPCNCFTVSNTRGGTAWSLFVGNTMGMLREYDLRKLDVVQTAPVCPGRKSHWKWAVKQMPFRRVYSGIMGSVRAVDVHCSGEVLAAVGLGRFAYIFDIRKKQMTEKVFLKQKLCSVLFSSEERKATKADEEKEKDKDGEEPEEAEGEEVANDEVQEGFTSDEGEEGAGPAGDDDEDSEEDEEEGAGGAAGEEEEAAEEDSDDDDEQCQDEAEVAKASAASGAADQAKGKRRRASEKPAGRKKRRGRGAS